MDMAGQAIGGAMGAETRSRGEKVVRELESRQTASQTPEDVDYRVTEIYADLLSTVGVKLPEGCDDTPGRAARAWAELTAGYGVDPDKLLKTFDAEGFDEMVIVRDIAFHSLCEHHLLPFYGSAHVGYIPNGKIVGLSKIPRLVHAYARRLQVQERLASQIADTMNRVLHAKGVIVVIDAEHMCMTMRGVRQPGSRTTTSVVRGRLKEDDKARSEALALIGAT